MPQQSVFNAFRYAWQGLVHFFRSDRNGRLHLGAAVLVVAAGFYFGISLVEWGLLILCIGVVMVLEMVNHAVEKLCDLVQPAYHPVIKIVKDVSAGAVLVAALASAVVGLIVFVPKIQSLL